MKFKTKNFNAIYCKNGSYNNKYDNDDFYYTSIDNIWYFRGYIIHKNSGPAIEWNNGTKEWLKNGKLHRKCGPAKELCSGSKEWHINGKRHRKEGPAIEYYNGDKEWYLNDKRHRGNGPAIEYGKSSKSWFLNGIEYSEKEYRKIISLKVKSEILNGI